MRRIAMLMGVAGLPLAAGAAVAQIGCDDPAITVSAAPASLDGFAVLFQQNGVTFYGRAAAAEGTPVARILIRNGNRFPVEVSYSVLLEYTADSLPRSLSLGRHCAQIPAGQYAVAEDAAPAPPSALRVRNLTIANLAAGQGGSSGPAVMSPGEIPKSAPVTVVTGAPASPGTAASGRGPVTVDVPANRSAPASQRVATAPPAAPPPTNRRVSPPAAPPAATRRTTTPTARIAAPSNPAAKGSALVARAETPASQPPRPAARTPAPQAPAESVAVRPPVVPAAKSPAERRPADSVRANAPVNRATNLGPVRPEETTVGAWALEATYAIFFLLSAIVMVAAGVGLAIPVLGGFALLLSLGVAALRRRAAGPAG